MKRAIALILCAAMLLPGGIAVSADGQEKTGGVTPSGVTVGIDVNTNTTLPAVVLTKTEFDVPTRAQANDGWGVDLDLTPFIKIKTEGGNVEPDNVIKGGSLCVRIDTADGSTKKLTVEAEYDGQIYSGEFTLTFVKERSVASYITYTLSDNLTSPSDANQNQDIAKDIKFYNQYYDEMSLDELEIRGVIDFFSDEGCTTPVEDSSVYAEKIKFNNSRLHFTGSIPRDVWCSYSVFAKVKGSGDAEISTTGTFKAISGAQRTAAVVKTDVSRYGSDFPADIQENCLAIYAGSFAEMGVAENLPGIGDAIDINSRVPYYYDQNGELMGPVGIDAFEVWYRRDENSTAVELDGVKKIEYDPKDVGDGFVYRFTLSNEKKMNYGEGQYQLRVTCVLNGQEKVIESKWVTFEKSHKYLNSASVLSIPYIGVPSAKGGSWTSTESVYFYDQYGDIMTVNDDLFSCIMVTYDGNEITLPKRPAVTGGNTAPIDTGITGGMYPNDSNNCAYVSFTVTDEAKAIIGKDTKKLIQICVVRSDGYGGLEMVSDEAVVKIQREESKLDAAKSTITVNYPEGVKYYYPALTKYGGTDTVINFTLNAVDQYGEDISDKVELSLRANGYDSSEDPRVVFSGTGSERTLTIKAGETAFEDNFYYIKASYGGKEIQSNLTLMYKAAELHEPKLEVFGGYGKIIEVPTLLNSSTSNEGYADTTNDKAIRFMLTGIDQYGISNNSSKFDFDYGSLRADIDGKTPEGITVSSVIGDYEGQNVRCLEVTATKDAIKNFEGGASPSETKVLHMNVSAKVNGTLVEMKDIELQLNPILPAEVSFVIEDSSGKITTVNATPREAGEFKINSMFGDKAEETYKITYNVTDQYGNALENLGFGINNRVISSGSFGLNEDNSVLTVANGTKGSMSIGVNSQSGTHYNHRIYLNITADTLKVKDAGGAEISDIGGLLDVSGASWLTVNRNTLSMTYDNRMFEEIESLMKKGLQVIDPNNSENILTGDNNIAISFYEDACMMRGGRVEAGNFTVKVYFKDKRDGGYGDVLLFEGTLTVEKKKLQIVANVNANFDKVWDGKPDFIFGEGKNWTDYFEVAGKIENDDVSLNPELDVTLNYCNERNMPSADVGEDKTIRGEIGRDKIDSVLIGGSKRNYTIYTDFMGVASLSTVGDITKKTYNLVGNISTSGTTTRYGITGAELLDFLYSHKLSIGFTLAEIYDVSTLKLVNTATKAVVSDSDSLVDVGDYEVDFTNARFRTYDNYQFTGKLSKFATSVGTFDLSKAKLIIDNKHTLTYNGNKQTVTFTVTGKYGNRTFTIPADQYKVMNDSDKAIDAGDHFVQITANGSNVTGWLTNTDKRWDSTYGNWWTINKLTIKQEDVVITQDGTLTYNRNPQLPDFTIKYGDITFTTKAGEALVSGSQRNAGEYNGSNGAYVELTTTNYAGKFYYVPWKMERMRIGASDVRFSILPTAEFVYGMDGDQLYDELFIKAYIYNTKSFGSIDLKNIFSKDDAEGKTVQICYTTANGNTYPIYKGDKAIYAAGEYFVRITGGANYGDNYYITEFPICVFNIAKREITKADIEITSGDFTYEPGKTRTVKFDVYCDRDNSLRLINDIHYTVTGIVSAIDAGTYKFTVNGIDDCTGSVEVEWSIGKLVLRDADVKSGKVRITQSNTLTFNGQEQSPEFKVEYRVGNDYRLIGTVFSTAKAVDAGNYTADISNFGGNNVDAEFTGVKWTIDKSTAKPIEDKHVTSSRGGDGKIIIPVPESLQKGFKPLTDVLSRNKWVIINSAYYKDGFIIVEWTVEDNKLFVGKTDEISVPFRETDNYFGSGVTIFVEIVEKPTQTGFGFVKAPDPMLYTDGSYTNKVENAKTDVTYSSSDETVATVDKDGKVTFLKAGTVTITARAEETKDYAKAEDSYQLTILKGIVTVTAADEKITTLDKLPTFAVTAEGLKDGETIEDIFVSAPTASTAANGKTAGKFPITVNAELNAYGSERYILIMTNAELTVEQGFIPIIFFDKDVKVAEGIENGVINVSTNKARRGDIVKITVLPDEGFILEALTVVDADGSKLTLKEADGAFVFTMPDSDVIVDGTFSAEEVDEPDTGVSFTDVPEDAYYYEPVKWAEKSGITSGIGNGLFAPDGYCTRAQIVTFLWRASGSPEPETESGFTDVPADAYYAKAVAWAVENGVTNGTGEGRFSPDDICTRAQAVTLLARLLGGKGEGAVTFIDVPADAYYAEAVAWAVENGVTKGVGGDKFAPNDKCTRAQIVTFMYRSQLNK